MMSKGKITVCVCNDTECSAKGANAVVDEFKNKLKIEVGETAANGMFLINCTRCIGACGLAPVVMLDDKTYGKVSPQMVFAIIREYEEQADGPC